MKEMERLDEWSKSGKNRDSFRNDRAHKVLQNDDKALRKDYIIALVLFLIRNHSHL